MSILDEGERLLAKLNESERRRAADRRDDVVVEVKLGTASTGHSRVMSKSIPRWKMRELGFDV